MHAPRIVLFILVLLAVACAGAQNSAAPDTSSSFRTIAVAFFSQQWGDSRGLLVFDTQQTYDAWSTGQDLRPPSGDGRDPMPNIDFSREVAVVMYLGARPDSSYHVRVDKVSANGATLVIDAVEYRTCGGAATVITHPLTVIAVSRGCSHVDAAWSVQACS